MPEYELNGVVLRVPEEMLTARLLAKLESAGYEADEAEAVQKRVRSGHRVLELGAGIGYIASLAARLCGAENLVTVEANPAMLPVIRANLDRNGFAEATLIHGAVTGLDASGEPALFEQKPSFWAGKLADENAKSDAVVGVPMLSLPELLAAYRPHVVIMDIEGAEAHLFERKWPRHFKSVMMELHPGQYPDTVIKKIVDCMSKSGLTYDPGPSRGRILGFRRVRQKG
jgi:FkbM family methyltransferase